MSKLSPAELERLAILAEECAEVVHIIGKIVRHGYESYHPESDSSITNRKLLEKELGDLECAVLLMTQKNDISEDAITAATGEKLLRIENTMHYNAVDGDLKVAAKHMVQS